MRYYNDRFDKFLIDSLFFTSVFKSKHSGLSEIINSGLL